MADRQGRRRRRPRTAISCASISPRTGRFGVPQARVLETLGNPHDQRKISLIAVHAHGIPDDFPESVLAEVRSARAADARGPHRPARRCRSLTIDPRRCARPRRRRLRRSPTPIPATPAAGSCTSPSPTSPITCAPARRLDREAQLRGNSVYFPDRVVPMLPERISNDLCSLREGEERALPRRAHGLRQARQQARPHLPARHDALGRQARPTRRRRPPSTGSPSATRPARCSSAALKPLWAAYAALAAARDRRAAARSRPAGAQDRARRAGPRRARRRRPSGSRRTG